MLIPTEAEVSSFVFSAFSALAISQGTSRPYPGRWRRAMTMLNTLIDALDPNNGDHGPQSAEGV